MKRNLPGWIREGGRRIRIGIGGVAMMLAASFCVRVRLGFLSDLKGVLVVAVSAAAVVALAAVRGRIGRERGRHMIWEKRFGNKGFAFDWGNRSPLYPPISSSFFFFDKLDSNGTGICRVSYIKYQIASIKSDRHAQSQRSKLTTFSLHQQKLIWKSTKMNMSKSHYFAKTK